MAETMLEGSAISAFCGGVAMMLAAGIQTDEAVWMLAEEHESAAFQSVCEGIYRQLIEGQTLSDAMQATQAFPDFCVSMVRAGEKAGRLEQVLQRLDVYYEEEERTFRKLRSSVTYPAALMGIMSVILAFAVVFILPVFVGVYESLTGTLTSGSFSEVGLALGIGKVALGVSLACCVALIALVVMSRTEGGRDRVMALLERLPLTRGAMYQLSLSRFTAALATYFSSGVNPEMAVREAAEFVTNKALRAKVDATYASMVDEANPRGLAQAIAENDVFPPLYARMLVVGHETGSSDETLSRLSTVFFEDALGHFDRIIDRVEPILAAFLTLTVGATIVAVMLPLIGIMRSIG